MSSKKVRITKKNFIKGFDKLKKNEIPKNKEVFFWKKFEDENCLSVTTKVCHLPYFEGSIDKIKNKLLND